MSAMPHNLQESAHAVGAARGASQLNAGPGVGGLREDAMDRLPSELLDRVCVGFGGSCWVWLGHKTRDGYGIIRVNHKVLMIHRVIYEASCGPIPDGLEIDHLCFVRACVNPDHLDAVTHKENMRRYRESNTHCKRGHPLSGGNLYLHPNEIKRGCRACSRIHSRNSIKRGALR